MDKISSVVKSVEGGRKALSQGNVRAKLKPREVRYTTQTGKTDGSLFDFMQLSFSEQLDVYNRKVESANRQLRRLRAKGVDVSAFTDIEKGEELLTEKGNFIRYPKQYKEDFEKASSTIKSRAYRLIERRYHKLSVMTEGLGVTEYERRVREKAEIEKMFGFEKPMTWLQYNATRVVTTNWNKGFDYYSVMQYAEEIGYIPDLTAGGQTEFKSLVNKLGESGSSMGYQETINALNEWYIGKYGDLPEKAVVDINTLKRREVREVKERPNYLYHRYGGERVEVLSAFTSSKLGF